MPEPAEVVARFIAAVEALDVDAALAFLSDEISYENVPIDPITGKEAVGATLRGFLGPASQVDWQVLRTVVDGSVVVNERLDRFRIGEGWLELPVAGFFEVGEDGRIRLWRDYFDLATYTRQLGELTANPDRGPGSHAAQSGPSALVDDRQRADATVVPSPRSAP